MSADAGIRAQIQRRYQDATGIIKEKSSATTSRDENEEAPGKEADSQDAEQRADAGQSLRSLVELSQRLLDLQSCVEEQSTEDVTDKPDCIVADLDALINTARSQFYVYRLDRLPPVWRDIFSDAHVLTTYHRLLMQTSTGEALGQLLDFLGEYLDRACIVAGKNAGSLGSKWIDDTMSLLEKWESLEMEKEDRPTKRMRLGSEASKDLFSSDEPFGRPPVSLEHAIPRHGDWSLEKFEDYMNDSSLQPRPLIFTNQIQDWPALTDKPWAHRSYLLSKTFRGRRLVPVEIGRSYVDDGWGQELIPFKVFLAKYIDPSSRAMDDPSTVGYLAQHNLFQQIPSLRNDITIPDFCWASVPLHPSDPSADKPTLDYPQLNAWFGPARTITPLHTDGYHNLLCQVVGTKYVRLYSPTVDKEVIRPRGEEMGVSMANTSELDVGVLEGWDEPGEGLDKVEVDAMRDDLKGVEYWEGILEPGDTLLIPIGWWHYVRSLSVSFSVSFWWN